MNEDVTWRSYLNELIRLKSAAEKKQLYEAVQVSRNAFQRWRTGDNTPDAAHLALLLKALPEPERQRLQVLILDDPRVRPLLPQEVVLLAGQPTDRIPQSVYEEVFRLGRGTPDHFWVLCSLILFHALSQLETHPHTTGVEISVARCLPARSDGKVRSLREVVGQGTAPWRQDLHSKDLFLGAEALAGYAVMQHHGLMVPDRSGSSIPVHWVEHENSCAAFPILLGGQVAGALLASCAVSEFFTPDKLTLLEKYADLIRLAFCDQEFVPPSSIELALMPSWERQQPHLASFRQRVQEEYARALREGESFEGLAQIEARVRQSLEGELLQLAGRSDEDATE